MMKKRRGGNKGLSNEARTHSINQSIDGIYSPWRFGLKPSHGPYASANKQKGGGGQEEVGAAWLIACQSTGRSRGTGFNLSKSE